MKIIVDRVRIPARKSGRLRYHCLHPSRLEVPMVPWGLQLADEYREEARWWAKVLGWVS